MAIAHDITSAFAKPDTLVDDWQQIGSSEEWEPGLRIGPYRLKQRLGKGGMGVVWLAEQLQPLQREVALKVMAAEGRDGLAETWFEIERQALAQLSHPCVAQIFDAGRLPDGALFFAMEYVPGLPLDEFQAEHRLDWRALATLFMRICAGVQHAHQRGLIHRDLKPLNVLVRLLDGVPAPKIIDFGIAVSALTGVAAPFRVDRVIGTPAYMSLEQRSPGPQGIDARCDIYALGVMLGEALARAGGEPIERDGLDVSAVQDAVRLELGQPAFDPARDSAALRARLRHCPRELLAIALKAMAVDREQRYESAAAMAEDLGRWLERRPVRAVGNARLYLLRCVVRRNRMASLAVALVLAAILAGSAMAWYGMNEARAAQALAEQRRDDAERLIQYMLGDFADKLRPIGRLDLLDSIGNEALRYLGAEGAGGDAASTLSRARALRTLGEVQVARQQFEQAQRTLATAGQLLRQAPLVPAPMIAEWSFESGQVAFHMGAIAYREERLDEAERQWRQYLADARAFARSGGERQRADSELAYAYSNLATLAQAQENLEEALALFGEAARIRRSMHLQATDDRTLDLANNYSWMATALADLGRAQEAWSFGEQALALIEDFRSAHPDSANARQREVNARLVQAQLAEELANPRAAHALLAEALADALDDVANDSTQPRRQAMLARIALTHSLQWPPGSAEGLRALQIGTDALAASSSGKLGAPDLDLLDSLHCLALIHQHAGQLACAPLLLKRLGAEVPGIRDRVARATRSAELVLAVARTSPGLADRWIESVEGRLESVPPTRRHRLRYLLSQRALFERFRPEDPRIPALNKQIQDQQHPRKERGGT